MKREKTEEGIKIIENLEIIEKLQQKETQIIIQYGPITSSYPESLYGPVEKSLLVVIKNHLKVLKDYYKNQLENL